MGENEYVDEYGLGLLDVGVFLVPRLYEPLQGSAEFRGPCLGAAGRGEVGGHSVHQPRLRGLDAAPLLLAHGLSTGLSLVLGHEGRQSGEEVGFKGKKFLVVVGIF